MTRILEEYFLWALDNCTFYKIAFATKHSLHPAFPLTSHHFFNPVHRVESSRVLNFHFIVMLRSVRHLSNKYLLELRNGCGFQAQFSSGTASLERAFLGAINKIRERREGKGTPPSKLTKLLLNPLKLQTVVLELDDLCLNPGSVTFGGLG